VKGGKTPIHRQPWYPTDYHEDEHVKLLKARHDYRTLTFYRHFIDRSFASGGDLPADPEALAAVVEMPRRDVEHALSFCLGRLITQDGERLFQRRVRRDVATELEFREVQSEHGKKGGRPKKERLPFRIEKVEVFDSESPPSPTPRAFSPAPPASAVSEPVLPPADRAERAIRLSTEALRTKLYGLIDTLAREDPEQADPTELMRMVTAYDKPDGTQVKGVVNAALLTHERLEKSIADAEAQLAEWREAKARVSPASTPRAVQQP